MQTRKTFRRVGIIIMEEIKIQKVEMAFQTREAYKTLRSNIEFSGDNIRTIAITSCTQNEGKSEVSFELARSFAENGSRALLIDADLRKSVLYRHFVGTKAKYGLSNYLIGKCSMDDAICRTNEEGFYTMFSGPVTPTPSELLNSERFDQLLKEGREQFDYLIIDTPPLGSVIDSAIIGSRCDGTILVIAGGEISYRFAQDVFAQLKQADCHVLGCILNKVDLSGGKGYYGKYYGRYYGKYYGNYYGEGSDE